MVSKKSKSKSKAAPKKKSKAAGKAPAGKAVNKSAWIRSQPATTPAKDVVAKAKAEGITLSIAQVYTARSTAKKKGPTAKGGRKRGPTAASSLKADDLEFKRLVLSIGLARAESYLASLKQSVGL